jgi:2-polyprenyl-3-methyl-5-hydroxy-6-metoxy-1,4-benzoquinol methylase
MVCRFCKTNLEYVFIDLGNSPPSNSFLSKEQLDDPEIFYPLKVYTCHNCFLVQIDEYKKSDTIFTNEYVYFSSYSQTWLNHAKEYTEKMIRKFGFNENSQIIEIASNDGYLLQYFKARNIPVLGIEPTANTAKIATEKGIHTIIDFFGVKLASRLATASNLKADLLLGNNVLAHVPDIMDFVAAMKLILKPAGIITMEFPHLMQLIGNNQFDTIYHEHYSYLSLHTVKKIFEFHNLELFDAEELPTHGGSLRVYAKHANDPSKSISVSVEDILEKERSKGMSRVDYYQGLQVNALRIKLELVQLLLSKKREGKKIAAYGAAAKGNTLLNYCGVKNDVIEYVSDANPHKQNKYLPASHIPVVNEEYLKSNKPDYVLILPWNLKEEIMHQLNYIKEWQGRFIIAIPEVQVI